MTPLGENTVFSRIHSIQKLNDLYENMNGSKIKSAEKKSLFN